MGRWLREDPHRRGRQEVIEGVVQGLQGQLEIVERERTGKVFT